VVGFPEGNYTGQITPYRERHGWGEMRHACSVFRYILLYFQSTGRVHGGVSRRELHRTDHALWGVPWLGGNEAGMLSIQIYSIIFSEWRTCHVCAVKFPEGNYTGQITPYGERHG
jgi:hypothetical protein